MVFVQATKGELAEGKDVFMQNASMSRDGFRRGGNRDVPDVQHPGGWPVAGSHWQGTARPRPNVGDLSQFGKINKVAPMSFAPTRVFNSEKGDPKSRDSPMSRTALSSNMFLMLQSTDGIVDPSPTRSSGPPGRKPSVGIGVGGASEPVPQRRKLQLLPRTRPVGEMSKVPTAVSDSDSDSDAEEGGTSASAVIPEQTKSKIDEDVKEFFSIRMLDVAESYFSGLPTEHRHRLVNALVMTSMEMKDADVKLVGDLFVRVREKKLCSPAAFEEGFNELADLLDDLAAVVVPKAWSYFAILLKGSGLDQDEERYARIAEKTTDRDKLDRLKQLL